MNESVPLVSIFCATYNHEQFIAQAIEGFLMQKTNFPVEIIICEDKSTDHTADIIAKYEKKFPGRLTVFYHKENLYSQKIDFFKTEFLPVARGRYFAFCEGDDYWIDPLKLQKQVDVMEENKDCSFSFHNAKTVFENTDREPIYSMNRRYRNKLKLTASTLIDFEFNITTASMLCRREALLKSLEPGYETTEKALQLLLSLNGSIIYLSDTMSVYRSNDQSVSYHNSKYRSTKLMIGIYNNFDRLSNGKYARTIKRRKIQLISEYAYNKIMNTKGRVFVLFEPVLLSRLIFYKIKKYSRVLTLNLFN